MRFYSVLFNDGAGSAYALYYKTREAAEAAEEEQEEGWGEPTLEEIDTDTITFEDD